MTTACRLHVPTVKNYAYGALRKEYRDGPVFFANIKSYGGTERISNDTFVIEDTLTLTTWYRPDIKADCRVCILQTNALYEVVNEPENWEMRNQFLVCKLRRVMGGG